MTWYLSDREPCGTLHVTGPFVRRPETPVQDMTTEIEVALIVDETTFPQCIRDFLVQEPGISIVSVGTNIDEAVRSFGERPPCILIIDVDIPFSEIAVSEALGPRARGNKAILLTDSEDLTDLVAAMQLGADAYVLKSADGPALIEVIRLVHAGGRYAPPHLAAATLRDRGRLRQAESGSALQDFN